MEEKGAPWPPTGIKPTSFPESITWDRSHQLPEPKLLLFSPGASSLLSLGTTVTAQKSAGASSGASGSGGAASAKLDPYLGLLYPIEDLRVYGYSSTSKVKFIAVLDDEEVKDAEMRAFFRRLHGLYVDTVANPFHPPESELYDCAKFQRQVDRLVDAGLY